MTVWGDWQTGPGYLYRIGLSTGTGLDNETTEVETQGWAAEALREIQALPEKEAQP